MNSPTNLIFLNTAAGLIAGITFWVFTQAAISRSSIRRKAAWRTGSTLFLIAIYTVAVGVALTGGFVSNPSVPYVAVAVTTIVATNLILLVLSASYRALVDCAPLHWLIASNVIRIVPGIVFLGLLDMGLLPREFALQAGYGDIITGMTALAVAYMIYKRVSYARGVALAWSIFGLLDLINALYLGQTTIPGFVSVLGAQGQPIGYINWLLIIPMAPVPLYLVLHILIVRKLSQYQTHQMEGQAVSTKAARLGDESGIEAPG